jgi:hypothetical protein
VNAFDKLKDIRGRLNDLRERIAGVTNESAGENALDSEQISADSLSPVSDTETAITISPSEESATFQEDIPPTATPTPSPIVYRIVSVIPNFSGEDEEREIVIAFSPQGGRFKNCRFGDIIVPGKVRNDKKLHCQAPRHAPGIVTLSISLDGVNYIGEEEFLFKGKGISVIVSYVMLGIVIVAMTIVVLSIWRRIRMGKKRKKDNYDSFGALKEPKSHKSTARRQAGSLL